MSSRIGVITNVDTTWSATFNHGLKNSVHGATRGKSQFFLDARLLAKQAAAAAERASAAAEQAAATAERMRALETETNDDARTLLQSFQTEIFLPNNGLTTHLCQSQASTSATGENLPVHPPTSPVYWYGSSVSTDNSINHDTPQAFEFMDKMHFLETHRDKVSWGLGLELDTP